MKSFVFGFIALSILATPALAGSTANGCEKIKDSIVCDNGESYIIRDNGAQPTSSAAPSSLGDFAQAASPASASSMQAIPYKPGTRDCFSLAGQDLGCAPRNQLPPGVALQNTLVRVRTTMGSDGSFGTEVFTFVGSSMYGRWEIASQYYPPTAADSSAPQQNCHWYDPSCIHIEAGTLQYGRCSDGGSTYYSNYGGHKYRSRSSYYRCYP